MLLVALWAIFPRHVLHVRLDNQEVTLPWVVSNMPREYDFVAEIVGSTPSVNVRPDDYLDWVKVNGVISWTTNDGNGLQCAYFKVPLRKGMRDGTNYVTFHVRDVGGSAGFDIKEAHYSLEHLALCAVIGITAFGLAFKAGCSPWLAWPIALGALLALLYLNVTTPWIRQHDVEGHREYIDHLLKFRTLPAVKQGWETWQPPLYYLLAAGWRTVFPGEESNDPFGPVQVLATCFFISTLMLSLRGAQRLALRKIELLGTVSLLAFLPGHLFLAARINNDVVLPLLGLGITLCVYDYIRFGVARVLVPLALLLAGILAAKTSSIAIVGGALLAIGIADLAKGRPWRVVLWRGYFVALPSIIWLAFWISRNVEQTGELLYVNASLPENMRVLESACSRLLSFDLPSFLGNHYYYDMEIRRSYPTALVTSILFGEYNLSEYGFQWSFLYRAGFLGLLIPLAAGVFCRPRPELRAAWLTCLALVVPQMLLVIIYGLQYPYSCNQNIRFAAQVFFPLACLCGLGLGHFAASHNRLYKGFLLLAGSAFIAGLADFYYRILF